VIHVFQIANIVDLAWCSPNSVGSRPSHDGLWFKNPVAHTEVQNPVQSYPDRVVDTPEALIFLTRVEGDFCSAVLCFKSLRFCQYIVIWAPVTPKTNTTASEGQRDIHMAKSKTMIYTASVHDCRYASQDHLHGGKDPQGTVNMTIMYNTISRVCVDFETHGAYRNSWLNCELNEQNFIEEMTVVLLIKVQARKISGGSMNLIRRL
jgi:hypothetical protein